jgi:opacity protein-like surface antigen
MCAIQKRIVLCCVSLLACVATSALAGTHPHDRNGFAIGFGFGGGSAGIQDGDQREGGGTGNFRIGYAVTPEILIHFEAAAWTRTFSENIGDVTWTFSTSAAAVTYFPSNVGVFVRGGIGIGIAQVEIEENNVKVSSDETGFGFLVAAGYEWRLTTKFALAPQIEYSYQDLDILKSSDVIGGGLGFNWYW